MKNRIVLSSILFTVAIAAVRFNQRQNTTETENKVDNLSQALKDVGRIVPQNGRIAYQYKDVNNEVYLWSRYLLAPRYLSVNKNEVFDTSLVICKNDVSDSAVSALIGQKKVVWSNKDAQYRYFLVSNNAR